ncbi:hypothetical protein SESBI_34518 [Sesbania bispinosa]|nr:hypothetical protein SESBI_34518 [Sesbania bispinosa]
MSQQLRTPVVRRRRNSCTFSSRRKRLSSVRERLCSVRQRLCSRHSSATVPATSMAGATAAAPATPLLSPAPSFCSRKIDRVQTGLQGAV